MSERTDEQKKKLQETPRAPRWAKLDTRIRSWRGVRGVLQSGRRLPRRAKLDEDTVDGRRLKKGDEGYEDSAVAKHNARRLKGNEAAVAK